MIWKSTPKSSSEAGEVKEWDLTPEPSRIGLGTPSSSERLRIDSSGAIGIKPRDWYETSSTTRMVEFRELEEARRKVIVLEDKTALLEEKMKHMEETFAKTVQDLVESLTKEHDERTKETEPELRSTYTPNTPIPF